LWGEGFFQGLVREVEVKDKRKERKVRGGWGTPPLGELCFFKGGGLPRNFKKKRGRCRKKAWAVEKLRGSEEISTGEVGTMKKKKGYQGGKRRGGQGSMSFPETSFLMKRSHAGNKKKTKKSESPTSED